MTVSPVEKKIRGIASLKLANIGICQTETATVYEVHKTMYPDFHVVINEDNELPASNVAFDHSLLTQDRQLIQSVADFKAEVDIDFPLCVVEGYIMQLTSTHLLTTNHVNINNGLSFAYSGKVIKALMTSIKSKPKDLIHFLLGEDGTLLIKSTKGSMLMTPHKTSSTDLAILLCRNYLRLDRETFFKLKLQSSVIEKLPTFNKVQQNLV